MLILSSHIFILKYYSCILKIYALSTLNAEHTLAATLLITLPVHFCNRYFDTRFWPLLHYSLLCEYWCEEVLSEIFYFKRASIRDSDQKIDRVKYSVILSIFEGKMCPKWIEALTFKHHGSRQMRMAQLQRTCASSSSTAG